jgi:hypothetical protein
LLLGAVFWPRISTNHFSKDKILAPNGFTADSQINFLIGVVGANCLMLDDAFLGHELHELALIILVKIKYLLRMALPLIRERKLVEFRIKWFEKSMK